MISFYSEGLSFKLSQSKIVKDWIKETILFYSKKVGDINIIFCNDDYLLSINRQFLNHDYYTDIVTFNNNVGNKINGELYISLDRVNENSMEFGVEKEYELMRVVIHGILHLIGFDDHTDEQELEMRQTEDLHLKNLKYK
ncbi:MAG: rRNA maturation RNase YbeY [Bacteroidota bacterium]|nr:rRNA maturation RNase YbeY [Bacteroidota bacterium]